MGANEKRKLWACSRQFCGTIMAEAVSMKWVGYAAGALVTSFLLNLVAFSMLLYGMDYHASAFRYAVADLGAVILYPGSALSPSGKIEPLVTAPVLGEW